MYDIDKVIDILRQTLRIAPDNIEARAHLGTLLITKGEYEKAKEHFEQVLKVDSKNTEALFGMGKTSFLLKDLADARIFLGKLLAITQNDHAEANLLMAKAYLELNDYVNARSYYIQAVNKDPMLANDDLRKKLYNMEDDKRQTNEEIEQSSPQSAEPIKMYIEGYPDEDYIPLPEELEEKEKITFNDIGGLDELKENIRHKIIYPFKNPEVYKAYGKKAGGGILLYGPPGCGKTYIAKATAGECNASFIAIGINDVLDMWLGESEKKLHNIFKVAREKTPSIIFIDEIDALGGSRQGHAYNSTKMLVNQLLSEMDGMDSVNDQILIVGATNSPWFVDSALRRPGRFDRVIFVAPPDQSARVEILHLLTQELKMDKFDFKKIAAKTSGFSGADLKALVDSASEDAINEALKTGHIRNLSEKDFLKALKKMKPTTREWFSTAKNYATYANQAGIYDDILDYIKENNF
jgi:SpoVK/Ycf46/Vps4 family AAA+-type ATPase